MVLRVKKKAFRSFGFLSVTIFENPYIKKRQIEKIKIFMGL